MDGQISKGSYGFGQHRGRPHDMRRVLSYDNLGGRARPARLFRQG
ncbi:hypothetical protein MA6G0728R_4904 [Mycobacteroides abscessus 6G-0728-R]|nr:hypothetical protein MA6G0125S_4973 [Mycobacteroides abscessus 6G-0125-S]EIU40172.1 hypothetical protein MA6G0125R_3934 [Mycobacteroides abscessus 6G-0125-R]EIU52430.1 hypothetical protein MA6G1108_4902 [Mycobacteroides abscessus 6G-1108]EIU54434.1 hypothetical protein MA6G0728S_4663 [Mycobacteroides abscessus 6G-0728-S]EIU89995.1 hypothetical protein MA6G0212_4959 [Mycobacteroides abscessus 6G-0212]EIU96088.1 hypothetical protein MA6G0728R_4904 [Mycobacteroides abscessus 6G-0728-R]EIV2086